MSKYKSFCSKCGEWTLHEYEYERMATGAMVIVTCIKCGHSTESFKEYQE